LKVSIRFENTSPGF